MEKYLVSPMTEVPFMYDDDKYEESGAGAIRVIDFADEQAFIHENMKLKTPHPPIQLFKENPLEYIMEFMFLPRPDRLAERNWEFYCLHWQPVTFHMLEICTEYISQKNVDLMNENAELERAVKGLGPRRTTVLTPHVYDAQTIERTRKPPKQGDRPWDRDDHIYCICEGVKLFPKNLAKNKRYKQQLNLPIPGVDYEVIRGKVYNELDYLRNRPVPPKVVKKTAAPAAKVGGVRRKPARTKKTDRNGAVPDDNDADLNNSLHALASSSRAPVVKKQLGNIATATATSGAGTGGSQKKRTTPKRPMKERFSDDEYVPGNGHAASPKKKTKPNNKKKGAAAKQTSPASAAATAGSSPRSARTTTTTTTSMPARRGRTMTRAAVQRAAATKESKPPAKGYDITVKDEDDVTTSSITIPRTLGSPFQYRDPATFPPDSDSDWDVRRRRVGDGDDDDGDDFNTLFDDECAEEMPSFLFERGYESDGSDKTLTQKGYSAAVELLNSLEALE
ncbi:uncharacterized protein BKCO1_290004 [Diplodia corticola]|uniref:Uncharacterized protein n=1 Tax=Diplodia corticola TaxID=236234 RepID=A0A1J9S0I9_9PEZI|nr:uncharacterized protein BKCO1_290004 [Diplodia corticola]OJD33540.1 hypothetical protein BKCO1_290004 [Diplodia corticola]